jgi:hypothetical protein
MENDTPSFSAGFEKKFISFTGKIGIFISLMLIPPVFVELFLVSGFVLNEKSLLWFYSVVLLVLSLALIIFPSNFKVSLSFAFFVLLFFILIELFTRLIVVSLYTDLEKRELGNFANKTYEEFAKYKGHPFLVYTGNPSMNYMDGDKQKETTVFNNMGFVGDDFNLIKQKNTIRIACIGGSTTERGYPKVTEYQLNRVFNNDPFFEVMNFGVSGWTSANSLTNYILNIRDFNPDYILIHHGWNEERIRNTPKDLFRSDYTHALTYFHEPDIIDKIPIRISLLYRVLKNKLSHTPDWIYLGDATTRKERKKTKETYNNIKELNVFKRNIKTIIDLCLINKTKVILSTQPFSLTRVDKTSKTIEQTNQAIRDIYQSQKPNIMLLDLDNTITGNMNSLFVDLAHMNEIGVFFKGTEFANAIIKDIMMGKDTVIALPPYLVSPISYHTFVNNSLSNQKKRKVVDKKAKERNLSSHEMLKKDAMYLFMQNNKNSKLTLEFQYALQEYRIRSNVEWMKQIEKQFKE